MPIKYYEDEKIFMLQGKESTYALRINSRGNVTHIHWGRKITEISDLPKDIELLQRSSLTFHLSSMTSIQEYKGFGGLTSTENAIKVTFADGTRDLRLTYKDHSIEGDTLKISMTDEKYPIMVTLCYRLCEEFDVIERKAIIKNFGDEDFTLETVNSAQWQLPNCSSYRLTYFTGTYSHEYTKNVEPLLGGKRTIESRRGISGPEAIPFFMIDDGSANEDFGGVYYGSLMWSGNWKMVFERDEEGRFNVLGGVNGFDFAYCLEGGDEYETPVFFASYTEGGYGAATRRLHRYERAEIIHPTEKNRILPVIYNTHGSLINRVNEENVLREVDLAHECGIELFVLDGGWTGSEGDIDSPLNNGQAHRLGFGTWEVNPDRFPRGLKPIADRIHSYGMKFGLWVEPENVHRENRIAKEHPEWLVGYNGREEVCSGWGCYSLNLANDEALEYITNVMINLIRENDIDYIKNDFNKNIYHLGWKGVPIKHQKEAWDKYVRNMWKLYSSMKEAFPNLIFENSAGGGKRMDLGMLRFSGRMHRSDNQDPVDSVFMHEGLTHFIPSKFQGGACFISDDYSALMNRRKTSMEYQAHVGMLSAVSVSLKFAELSEERRRELKLLLDLNREIRHTVQMGDMYRLVSVVDGGKYGAYQYLEDDKSKAVVFVLGINMMFGVLPDRLRLKDLDPDAKYEVIGHGTYYKYLTTNPNSKGEIPERTKNYGVFTGRGLMNSGIHFSLIGHATSEIFTVTKIK